MVMNDMWSRCVGREAELVCVRQVTKVEGDMDNLRAREYTLVEVWCVAG